MAGGPLAGAPQLWRLTALPGAVALSDRQGPVFEAPEGPEVPVVPVIDRRSPG